MAGSGRQPDVPGAGRAPGFMMQGGRICMSQSVPQLEIDGVVPIIPTPFESDGAIAVADFASLIEFACSLDVCAICLPAYASEFYKLSEVEREELVAAAVKVSRGRMPVVAQVNYAASKQTASTAAYLEQLGASAISVAVPRMFALCERDLYRHLETVLRSVTVPVIVQDYYPSGATISPSFIASLNRAYPHFQYVKLEEPLMAEKVQAIREATGGAVGVLEGWGGMYVIELANTELAGLVPGLAVADILARVWRLARGEKLGAAFQIFQRVLPQILYSLENMELFHHAEKQLLQARGIILHSGVRDAGLELSPSTAAHIQFLNQSILELLDDLQLPRNPAKRGEKSSRKAAPAENRAAVREL
jgi:dihydrodipicolinate synthase/N-acetylneuraminate lyase